MAASLLVQVVGGRVSCTAFRLGTLNWKSLDLKLLCDITVYPDLIERSPLVRSVVVTKALIRRT